MVDPSIPGPTHCLKCQKTFNSKDRIRLRICPKCTKENEVPTNRQKNEIDFVKLHGFTNILNE